MKQLRETITSLALENVPVIRIFNPQCYAETVRYIQFIEYTIPDQGRFQYVVLGKDVTDLFESGKLILYSNTPVLQKQQLIAEIEGIPQLTYKFGRDYSFELIS